MVLLSLTFCIKIIIAELGNNIYELFYTIYYGLRWNFSQFLFNGVI